MLKTYKYRLYPNKKQAAALTVTTFLEQTPLAARHLSPKQALHGLTAAAVATREAVQQRSKSKMFDLVQSVVRDQGPITQQLLKGEIKGTIAGKQVTIPGLNLEQAVDDITTAMKAQDNALSNSISATRYRKIIMGRAGERISAAESLALLKESRGSLKAFQEGIPRSTGTFSKFVS